MTLVTAKNQHRCWKARAYTRTRRKTQIRPNLPYKQHKIFCRFFLDFSLFEDFSPPISIGTHSRCTFTMRNSNYQLHFHGESLSTYIPSSGASSYIPSRQPPVTVYYSSSILQVSRQHRNFRHPQFHTRT